MKAVEDGAGDENNMVNLKLRNRLLWDKEKRRAASGKEEKRRVPTHRASRQTLC